ncbi:MAG TPA: ATP-binding cassette domain-containing protein [Solirubrobacteraceae bacterium]|nr:ATP-binding cassette domain-containing protein [Solirubrobacteraceae bacterium]
MTLVLDTVCKRYASGSAVSDVSFEVPRGAIFGLLGPNGAGKTTTIRMTLDIIRPDSGELRWDGRRVAELPRLLFGYLPEERGLYADMPVAEQVAFFGEISGLSRRDAKARTARWLERMDVAEHVGTPVAALSKGNQQKVQLLAAVVHEPRLLILDEPFSGLDPVNHALLREVLPELQAAGTAIVLSTHDLEQVESLCDALALMHRSRLVFSGPVADLRARHRDRSHVRLLFRGDDAALRRDVRALEPDGPPQGDWLALGSTDGASVDDLARSALRHGELRELRTVEPTLREIFLKETAAAAG